MAEPLQPFLVAEDECGEKVLRYRKPMPGQVAEAEPPPAEAANADRHEIPPWLFQPAAVEAPRLVSLSPSSAFAEDIGRVAAPATASAAERRNALARGRIVHRLMQSLPDIPAAGRQDAIERYLKGAAADFLPAERAEIARQVLTILNDLVFADVFAPGSRAEVPIVGRVAGLSGVVIAVSGQVDRLAVTGETVLIADYKTDRAAPAPACRGAGRLRRPARALPRRAGAHLPGKNDSRRIDLHRGAERHGGSRRGDGGGARRNHEPSRVSQYCELSVGSRSRPSEAVLTPSGAIHRFNARGLPILRKSEVSMVDKVTDATFEQDVLKATEPVVVDFWAEWCGPCRMIAPALEEISKSLNGKVKIVKLNVDENPGTAAKFGIMSIPTLMLFKGGQLASRQVGAAPKQKLEQWITGAV